MNLFPQYSQNGTITSYTASNIISFRAPISEAGNIIDQAVNFGATTIQDVTLVASQTAIDAAREQAITLAIQDARRLANVALEEVSLTPGTILSIEVLNVNTPGPQPLLRAATDSFASTPIVGGQQQITARVAVKIAI